MKNYRFIERWLLFFILLVFSLSGCSHYHENTALGESVPDAPYEFSTFNKPPNADETFVALAFSGGGTRAASLSYGVLKELRDTRLPGTDRTLLDEVDIISTVSGGSFTGAYYALFKDKIFTDFEDAFLKRDIQGDIAKKVINPYNWFRLASPYFSRIDLAAELYDQTIFNSESFNTLTQNATRPFLIINATNLYQGARFEFTGPQFQYLCSDILSYPVSRAVAASSAFPFLLTPISLVNNCSPEGHELPDDNNALEDYWRNKRRYYDLYNNYIYSRPGGVNEHPYVHLMDGGLADNIGLRAIHKLYVREDIRSKINNGKIKHFLVIVVNAKTEKAQTIDKNEAPPGLVSVGFKTATLSMDNYSFETVEMFKDVLDQRKKAQDSLNACQDLLDKKCSNRFQIPKLAGGDIKLYLVDLTFDNLPLQSTDPEIKDRSYYNELPTTFALSHEEVNNLIRVGGHLLRENPDFQEFLENYTP